ncbi:MAG: adenylate/guanylate cyclase domain-containing protein [Elusimicrobia bacterium]|nr:adenylate/guanylate cyclase domain-containing protein [Elusimicrobiota bacterium]
MTTIITRLWRGVRNLHLPLYILFWFMINLGGITSSVFMSYSLIDIRLLEAELSKAMAAGRNNEPPRELVEKIFHPLKTEKSGVHYSDKKGREGTREAGQASNLTMAKESDQDISVSFGSSQSIAGLYGWLLVLWLWPLYRYRFFRKKPDPAQVERRIINLPLVIFALVWVIAVQQYFIKTAAFAAQYGVPGLRIKMVFAVAALLFGAFVSYLNLELTQLYIRRFIAKPFFLETNPHGLKRGFAIGLTLRHGLMMFSLAMVPLLLSLYVPVSFNIDAISGLRHNFQWTIFFQNHRALIPCLIIALLVVVVLPLQLASVAFFKWSVQKPIDALVRRMRAVAAGDFSCKTSVLYADEIGQLKGHFNLMLDGLAERERIKDTFGKYVSIEIAAKIMKSGKVNLAGEEIRATILFSDIRNFTPLSEKLPPTELIRFLNEYFTAVTRPITDNQGVINKFMGDAVMAIFSPVFGVTDHAEAALRAALGMKDALRRFNATGDHEPVSFGVGMHTGGLIAGNVGTENRLEYTVLGDTVNVASRVEGQTKQFLTEILVSEALLQEVDRGRFPGIEFTACGPVLMKGKTRPMLLYKVAGAAVQG